MRVRWVRLYRQGLKWVRRLASGSAPAIFCRLGAGTSEGWASAGALTVFLPGDFSDPELGSETLRRETKTRACIDVLAIRFATHN